MPLTAKTYDCWCVFDPDGVPKWYTCRSIREQSLDVLVGAMGLSWEYLEGVGYTVRKVTMTEVK